MSRKKLTAIAIAVLGLILFSVSCYTRHVTESKMKVELSHKKPDTTNSNFSMSKYSKPIGDQKTIVVGQKEVAKHEKLTSTLCVVGIILILAGVGLFFYWRKK